MDMNEPFKKEIKWSKETSTFNPSSLESENKNYRAEVSVILPPHEQKVSRYWTEATSLLGILQRELTFHTFPSDQDILFQKFNFPQNWLKLTND